MATSRCAWILGLVGTAALVLGCAPTPQAEVAARFQHRIPVEVGKTEVAKGARLEIKEVSGTRPRIEANGVHLVGGRYRLTVGDAGALYLRPTAENWDNIEPDDDMQRLSVGNGDGTFSLVSRGGEPGVPHVGLHAESGGKLARVANMYFGTGGTEGEPSRTAAKGS